jgi:NAD(P)H dehydrogenase (quinone)
MRPMDSSLPTIAVSAASGRLGRALLPKLQGNPSTANVVAICRDPDRQQRPGLTVRPGDYADPSSMQRALAGVNVLIMISAPVVAGIDRVPLHRNVIAAARRAGVRWLLFTSVVGTGGEVGEWFKATQQVNRQTENDVRDSGMAWTIGRNGLYLDLDLRHMARSHAGDGHYRNSGGAGRTGYLTIDEIAAAFAAAVHDPRHQAQLYHVTGERHTQEEIVAAANRVMGWQNRYECVTDEQCLAAVAAAVGSRGPEVAKMLAGAFQSMRAGALDVESDFARMAGRPPKSLEQMLTDLRLVD